MKDKFRVIDLHSQANGASLKLQSTIDMRDREVDYDAGESRWYTPKHVMNIESSDVNLLRECSYGDIVEVQITKVK